MTRTEIASRLMGVVRDVFDLDDLPYDDTLAKGKIEAWDRVGHIRVLLAVEKEFGLRFTSGEVDAVKNAGEMLEIVMQRSARL